MPRPMPGKQRGVPLILVIAALVLFIIGVSTAVMMHNNVWKGQVWIPLSGLGFNLSPSGMFTGPKKSEPKSRRPRDWASMNFFCGTTATSITVLYCGIRTKNKFLQAV